MNKQAVLLALALFVAIVGGMFLYAHFKSLEYKNPLPTGTVVAPQEEKPLITRIDGKHYFIETRGGGAHTVVGELMLPTTCDLLTTEATVLDQGKRVRIAFDVVNNSTETCPQAEMPQRFKVGFNAEKDAVIEATYKGKTIPINLIEAGPGEDPNDFELFMKG